MKKDKIEIPLVERLKVIPGIFGIRLAEEPRYDILQESSSIEVRPYPPLTLVTTPLSSTDDESREEGMDNVPGFAKILHH